MEIKFQNTDLLKDILNGNTPPASEDYTKFVSLLNEYAQLTDIGELKQTNDLSTPFDVLVPQLSDSISASPSSIKKIQDNFLVLLDSLSDTSKVLLLRVLVGSFPSKNQYQDIINNAINKRDDIFFLFRNVIDKFEGKK